MKSPNNIRFSDVQGKHAAEAERLKAWWKQHEATIFRLNDNNGKHFFRVKSNKHGAPKLCRIHGGAQWCQWLEWCKISIGYWTFEKHIENALHHVIRQVCRLVLRNKTAGSFFSTPTEPESSGNLKLGWTPPIHKQKRLTPKQSTPCSQFWFCLMLLMLENGIVLMSLRWWFLMLAASWWIQCLIYDCMYM